MGATSRQMPTRRRTTSMDMEFPPSTPIQQPQSVRGGYKSDTSRRRSNVNRKLNYDSYSNNANGHGHRQMMRRRSTGFYEPETTQPSHEEDGEASDHSNGGISFMEPDEHDSQSSSNPSLEEGTKGNYNNQSTNGTSNHYQNNPHYQSNPNTPIGKRRIRPMNSNGNKSDPELGSNSVHKRALHEAGFQARGNRIHIKNDVLPNINNLQDGQRSILRTSSETSESSFPNDDSNKSRISTLDNNSNSNNDNNNNANLLVSRGNDEPPMLRTNFKLTERILTSNVWRIFKIKNPIFLLLIMGVSMMGVGLYTQSYATLSLTLDQVILNEHERRQKVEGHFETIERDMNNLQRQLLELHPDASLLLSGEEHSLASSDQQQMDSPNDSNGVFDEIVAVKERIRQESSRISSFEKHIQATSLRDATRKYGTGVVRVELTLDFLSDRTNALEPVAIEQQTPHTLILEMAPLDLMPHSVYTFLEMVDNHLLDGISFILNAMNIIKAAPLPYEKNGKFSAKQIDENFRRLGLETVSFREYNEAYPHEQYTVGFAADGGPDFYINTGDNTEEHTGEPCFARIVSGFETVTKMEEEPLRSGMWIKKRIGIKKAIVL